MTSPLDPGRREAILSGAIGALLDLPDTIDRYVVRGELGRGGMGVVYDAIDPHLERPVAIKVINPSLLGGDADAQDLEVRFQREMRAVSPIFHPNVVTILDAGLTRLHGEPTAYYVMERIQGESLEDRLRRSGPLDRKESLEIASGVARGLEALHAQGLVHRDVKPSNVLLPIGRGPKVSDFGLVHLTSEPSSSREDPVIAGSAHGLAPEQIHSEKVDGRADLFALGALLIRLFTGEEPFSAPSLSGRLRRIDCDGPDGLDQLPADVAALAEALLSKSPGERPQRAHEVADQLDAMKRKSGGWRALLGPVVAIAGILAVGMLSLGTWRDLELERALEREAARHAAEVAAQIERAEILSANLLPPSTLASLPADERRAGQDRLDGIANRIAFERVRHAEAVAALDQERGVLPLSSGWRWLLQLWTSQGGIDSAASERRDGRATFSVQDPRDHLSSEQEIEVQRQLLLLEREFGLVVEIALDSSAFGASPEQNIQPRPRATPPSVLLETPEVETVAPPNGGVDHLAGVRAPERFELGRIRIALDLETQMGSIEATRALEPLLPDAVLGALLREQILPLAIRGETAFGLRLAFRILRERLRQSDAETLAEVRAAIGSTSSQAYAGGGIRAHFTPEAEGLSGLLDEPMRARLGAGATVDEAWQHFMEWLSLETADANVGVFSPASRNIIQEWPASRPYWRALRRREVEEDFTILERGGRALLFFRVDREVAPTFFHKSATGWQIDLAASRDHLISIADRERRWTFRNIEAEPLASFHEDLAVRDALIRLSD